MYISLLDLLIIVCLVIWLVRFLCRQAQPVDAELEARLARLDYEIRREKELLARLPREERQWFLAKRGSYGLDLATHVAKYEQDQAAAKAAKLGARKPSRADVAHAEMKKRMGY